MADAGELFSMNLDAVRSALRDGAQMSRNALARATGLSFPTVGRAVEAMLEAGELLELGLGGSTGGRCARLYALNPRFAAVLCMRLEGGALHWFVGDLLGGRLEEGRERSDGRALETIDTLVMRVRARNPQLGAIAAGIAGTVNRGVITESFLNDELRGVSLSTHLTGLTGLPATVQGDMAAAAAGYSARCTPMPRAAVCIYCGESCVGCGLVLEGRVWCGASEFAGEVSYLPVIENCHEISKQGYPGIDMADYYARLIRAYVALVNPDRVVLYQNAAIEGRLDEVRRICARTLPAQAIPQIESSDAFAQDYERGLYTFARRLLQRQGERKPG